MIHLTDPQRVKLRDALAVKSALAGNLLTLIGVEEIKEQFPDLWAKKRELILETVRTVLKQHSDAATDTILPYGGDRFVVLFGNLSQDEAMIRAGMIKAEVLRRFAGDAALGSLDVDVTGMDFDTGEIKNGNLGKLLDAAASEQIQAAEEAASAEQRVPSVPVTTQSEAAKRLYRASIGSLTHDHGENVESLEKQFGFNMEDLEFAFLPHLYTSRNVFSVFECLPARVNAIGHLLTGYDVLARDPDKSIIVELDHMSLMRARHGLVDMAIRKRSAVVVVTLSFDTISERGAARAYLETIAETPSDLQNYLVLSINRVPEGVPEGRFAELVAPFRKHCRAIVVSVSSSKQSIAHAKASGAFCVAYDINELSKTTTVNPALVKKLVDTARRAGMQISIKGVSSKAVLRGCRALRVDYLAGQILAEMSDYVGPISEYRA